MDLIFRPALAPNDTANPLREDKFDFTAADLFVEAHGGKEFRALSVTQFHSRGQTGSPEKIFNPRNVAFRQT